MAATFRKINAAESKFTGDFTVVGHEDNERGFVHLLAICKTAKLAKAEAARLRTYYYRLDRYKPVHF